METSMRTVMKKNRLASLVVLVVLGGFAAQEIQAAAIYPFVIQAANPVGYWRLNETSGPAVNSGSAGASLNGTYNNFPTGVRGVPGLITDSTDTAAQFNGLQSASGSSVSDANGMNTAVGGVSNPFANDWTIEAWFVRTAQHQWSGIFSNNNGGNTAPIMTFIDNTHQLGVNGTGITPNNVSVDLGLSSLGERVYAVITKTGGNGAGTSNLSVYANVGGTWLPTATGTNVGWSFTPQDGYYIGRHYTSVAQMHEGVIDEVAIYNRALSLAEINAHFDAGFSENPPAPEPATCTLLALGMVALALKRRRDRQSLPTT
jgi:large repetitive protein